MRRISVLVVAMLMAGCVTTQEQIALQAKADDAACQSYGAKPSTPEYIQCRTTKSQQHEMALATVMAGDSSPTTCRSYGAGVMTCN